MQTLATGLNVNDVSVDKESTYSPASGSPFDTPFVTEQDESLYFFNEKAEFTVKFLNQGLFCLGIGIVDHSEGPKGK